MNEITLAVPQLPSYRVYFYKETGFIAAINNVNAETLPDLVESYNWITVPYHAVEDFLIGKKRLVDYKVFFVNQSTPNIVKINAEDSSSIFLSEVKFSEQNATLSIEYSLTKKEWAFKLSNDQRNNLKNHNLGTKINFFIVDRNNDNYLYRTIEIPLEDLIYNDVVCIPFKFKIEETFKKIKILIRNFFESTGYRIVTDANI